MKKNNQTIAFLLGTIVLFTGCVGEKGEAPETSRTETVSATPAQQATEESSGPGSITIHYLGHASFVIQFDDRLTVLTDYGKSRAWGLDSPIYDLGGLLPDVVTYSHMHEDHAGGKIPDNVPNVLMYAESLSIQGVDIVPIRTCEKEVGKKDNRSYLFTYKGFKILHLADAQAYIENIDKKEVREEVKRIYPDTYDILLLTIGGMNDITEQAEIFIDLLQPRRVIPMHYWSLKDKEEFLANLENKNQTEGKHYVVEKKGTAKYTVSTSDMEDPIRVISLNPAPFSPSMKNEEPDESPRVSSHSSVSCATVDRKWKK